MLLNSNAVHFFKKIKDRQADRLVANTLLETRTLQHNFRITLPVYVTVQETEENRQEILHNSF